jgi:hypothetical protein
MSTKNITRYLGSIFLLLSLTITQNAYAEGFDLFKPNDDNWLIKNIFIPLFYPDTSPFSHIWCLPCGYTCFWWCSCWLYHACRHTQHGSRWGDVR